MSNLWITAERHDTMALSDVMAMRSQDYPTTVGKTRSHMESDPENDRATYREHGGMHGYINHLSQDIRENGMKRPLIIANYDNGMQTLWDGHHRAHAAAQAAQKEVPVVHATIGELTRGRWG